jgi:hypothetical protein
MFLARSIIALLVMNELRIASNVKYGCDRKTRF